MKTIYLVLLFACTCFCVSAQSTSMQDVSPTVKMVCCENCVSMHLNCGKDYFTITVPLKYKEGEVVFYNNKGRKVRKEAIGNKINDISMQGLDAGKYKVQVIIDRKVKLNSALSVSS